MNSISNDFRVYSELAAKVEAVAQLDDLDKIGEGVYLAGEIVDFKEQVINVKPYYEGLCEILLDKIYDISIRGNGGIAA
jgi:hypothetical protein